MRVYQPYPSYTSAVLVSKEASGKNKSKKEKKNDLENRTERYQFVFPSGVPLPWMNRAQPWPRLD